MLFSESDDGENDTSNRRSDEQQQTELDKAASTQVESVVDDATDGAQIGGFAAKYMIIGGFMTMTNQINDTTREHINNGKIFP